MKNNKIKVLSTIGGFMFIVMFGLIPANAKADFTQIGGGTMKVGVRGSNVTATQNLLASNSQLYPQGTVTGYFGMLTKAAVVQFQLAYDLVADGIAGPGTKAKMNSLILAGRGLDIFAPTFSNVVFNVSGKNASLTFNTSEPVIASIFHDTNNLSMRDSGMSFGQTVVSGIENVDSNFSSSKQFSLTNLSANTNYNYAVRITDASGNVSVLLPKSFRTAQ
ncbi:MAG: peptidoglycan-binding domain-containing protein [Patescibacteria group bacterium]